LFFAAALRNNPGQHAISHQVEPKTASGLWRSSWRQSSDNHIAPGMFDALHLRWEHVDMEREPAEAREKTRPAGLDP
jgi:hypothetical protein